MTEKIPPIVVLTMKCGFCGNKLLRKDLSTVTWGSKRIIYCKKCDAILGICNA